MVKLKELFEIKNAKSKGFEDYEEGSIPFVTNGDYDNAVLGYVKPMRNDRIFKKKSICLSTFCEASVPDIPFIARGNGGSGLVVLIPKDNMSEEEIYFYASQLNMLKWRFSFSRMLISKRIEDLEVIRYKELNFKINKKLNETLPKDNKKNILNENRNIGMIKVSDLCKIETRKAPPQNDMNLGGNIPYVTTSSFNNGVSEFVDEKPNSKGKCLSVAMNGDCKQVFFQIDDFITSADNSVLTLKEGYNPYLLFFIGALIKKYCWRYGYTYKLSKQKLENMKIPMPFKNKEIDLEYIEKIVKNAYSFDGIKDYL